jgi:hypothetical protein
MCFLSPDAPCKGVTAVLQAVLQQCYSSVTAVSQQCYSNVTTVTSRRFLDLDNHALRGEAAPPIRTGSVAVVLMWCYKEKGEVKEC